MKVLFLDRDGTLIDEPVGGLIDSLEKLKILPYVIESLQKLQAAGYTLIMISNQPGRGTVQFPEENFITPQNKLMETFAAHGITFTGTFFCPHFREDNCVCMKPKTALLDAFLKENDVDLKRSFTVGDRETDIELARNIGCNGIFYSDKQLANAVFISNDWRKITDFILTRK